MMRRERSKIFLLVFLFLGLPIAALSDQQVFMNGKVYTLTAPKKLTGDLPCSGNACGYAKMAWNGNGYTIHNGGSHRALEQISDRCRIDVLEAIDLGVLRPHLRPVELRNERLGMIDVF